MLELLTITRSELLQMKTFHELQLNIINKKLQAENQQKGGLSKSPSRKGLDERIEKTKAKRLSRIYKSK